MENTEQLTLLTMKFFWRYLFPPAFGLLIYTSIRLVTDTPAGEKFWERPVWQNGVEIFFTALMGYLFDWLLRYAIHRFSRENQSYSLQNVVREFGILLLACMVILNPVVLLIHHLADDPIDWADVTIANILVVLYVLLYYAIVRGNSLIRVYIEQQMQIERLKNDQLETELKFLKAQYHPHFLFNALNTIYFQMDDDIPAAKRTVEKFSDLLRYQLYDQHQLVPVKKEIQHLQNFIHLQKERASSRLLLAVSFDDRLDGEKIYPLLLLPLVENAFKYVGGNEEVRIEAVREQDYLTFRVRNGISSVSEEKGGGIGLENLKRRLQLLYPGRYHLAIERTQYHYEAFLKLPLL